MQQLDFGCCKNEIVDLQSPHANFLNHHLQIRGTGVLLSLVDGPLPVQLLQPKLVVILGIMPLVYQVSGHVEAAGDCQERRTSC